MSVPANLAALAGEWAGPNRLWLAPDTPVRESETRATVALAAEGKFLTIRYTWADDGAAQSGLLLVGVEADGAATAAWVDSWHMQDKMMVCRGTSRDGAVSVTGSYEAPPGPDWGWRIEILPKADGTFQIVMYNITPDGSAFLAVEATYRRAS